MTTAAISVNDLFDLIAPIAITGGADLMFEKKAEKAWEKIVKIDPGTWTANNCPNPLTVLRKQIQLQEPDMQLELSDIDLSDENDFLVVYDAFAKPAYDALLEEIVNLNGDDKWEAYNYDYWGAKAFKRPGDTSKSMSLAGDACGQYPWYETAAVLIERIKKIEAQH